MKALLPVLIVLIFSCKKNSEASVYTYPSAFVSSNYQITSSTMIYTKSGQITNFTEVGNFLNGMSPKEFPDSNGTVIKLFNDTITFKTKDSVVAYQRGVKGNNIARQVGQFIFLYMTDTLVATKEIGGLHDIIDNIGLFKPYRKDACANSNPSPCPIEMVNYFLFGTLISNEFEMPFLTYFILRSANNTLTGVGGKINNLFDNSVVNMLTDGDTLLIQTAKRVYLKQP